jgi:hypothetical protein
MIVTKLIELGASPNLFMFKVNFLASFAFFLLLFNILLLFMEYVPFCTVSVYCLCVCVCVCGASGIERSHDDWLSFYLFY